MHRDAIDGGEGSGAGPFAYYPATASEVAAWAGGLLSAAERIAGVADRAYAQERHAIAATAGELAALFDIRLAELRARSLDVKGAAIVAAGALSIWARAIDDYNAGISELNAEYALARGGVPGARAALMPSLRARLGGLEATLDDVATRVASILRRGPSESVIMRLFQHGTLPLWVTSLLSEYDFSDVDVGELVRRLQRHGDLPYDLDAQQIAAAVRMLERLTDPDNALVSWSRTVLTAMWEQLSELDPHAVDFLVLGLSDDQLELFDRLVSRSRPDNPMLPALLETGLDRFDLADLHTLFLANASVDTLRRLQRTWRSIEPTLRNVDAVESGDLDRPRWGDPPTDDLFDSDASGHPLVSANDIDQGAVGDCWMQSKLAALARDDPAWVTDHVRRNANGTITVTFYDEAGEPHEVTVTRPLPVDRDGQLVYSGADGTGASWADYYEKALALISDHQHAGERGYGGIESGSTFDDAQLMTGHDAEEIDNAGGFLGFGDHKDFNDVREHVEDGDAVVVGTTAAQRNDLEGFVASHQFYVDGFDDDEIVLRNPWSTDEDVLTLTEDEFNNLVDGAAVINHD